MDVLLEYSFYFLIYGFLGWIVEVVSTGIGDGRFVNRGFLFSPLLPIYGFGAVILIASLSGLTDHILLLYIVSVIVTTLIEYFASLFLENVFHVKWWDYSKYKYNIQGRVCLRNSIFFGLLSTLVILLLHPPIANFVTSLSRETISFIVDLCFTGLIIDLFFTLRKLNDLSVRTMDNVSGQTKSKNAKLPELFNGKYTEDRISNLGINVLITISVGIGMMTMFIINIYFGLIMIIVVFVILYGTFKRIIFTNKKQK